MKKNAHNKKTQTPNKIYDVVVIGGGASGLFAASIASGREKSVLIIEKNAELGKKLKITGGGRCNITNAEFDTRLFLDHFPQTKKFLYSPFSQFAVRETFAFFEQKCSLPLVVQERQRAFPASEDAHDVCTALEKCVRNDHVEIVYDSPVTKIVAADGLIHSVRCGKQRYRGRKFILATGGLAAPETGSSGDGFTFLEELGHTIKKPSPTVVPLTSNASWVHHLSGTTLRDVKISFVQDAKVQITKKGDVLCTHFGVSGPLILNSATAVGALLEKGDVYARVDLFPQMQENALDAKILALFAQHKNKSLKNVLPELIPKALCHELLTFDGMPSEEEQINNVTKEQRKHLVQTLKNLTFPITGTLGFDKAVIVDGGVIPEEVNFSTMTSRLYPNLYLIGDTLSINRPSGGYSLQLCWTTGYVAGMDC